MSRVARRYPLVCVVLAVILAGCFLVGVQNLPSERGGPSLISPDPLRDRRDIADMVNHPFPVSFGPASVAPVLGIRRRLRQLAGDPGGLDAVFAHAVSAATTAAEARAAFTDKLNAHSAGQADVATLVAAWLQTSTNRAEAVPFIVETLRRGIPVFGQQSGSRVVTARAGKKWIKANGRLRGMFTSVDVFSAVMEAVLFEFFPRVQELLGDGATPRDVCKAAKNGIKRADGVAVAVLFVEQSGQVLTVAVEKRNETMAAQGAVDLADYVELLRYAAFYTCRETEPPTIVPNYTSALTGWQYNQPEEDILTALHVPLFERELASLRLEAKAATAENPDRDASRTMLHAQIKILEQYFSVHAASNAAFHTRAWGTVAVGGAGRASAEVARDLSKFYPGAITTIAIDHRKTGADTMEKDGHLKSAFANFVKELSKDHGHLPKFADPTVAAHYAALYAVLAEKRVDKRTLDNLARILQANSLNVDGTALKDDEGKGKSAFTASTHFLLALGDRGSGDVLFAAPHCHATYAPNTMEEVMLVHFAAILK